MSEGELPAGATPLDPDEAAGLLIDHVATRGELDELEGVYGPDELAVRFHHRLVSIHPFPNGNGRHARLMADLLVRDLGGEPFSWGGASLTSTSTLRAGYISALHAADEGDIGPLLRFARS